MKSQNKTDPSTYNLEALREEWRELMYRIAATEYVQQEADLFMEQIAVDEANGNTKKEDDHFAQMESKTLRVIRRAIRKRKLKQFAQHTLPKLGKVAASILLTLFIGLSVAIASVQTVRVRVLELLINIENEYTELSLQENPDSSFDVPPEWDGNYYPSKIPKGFVVTQIESMFENSFVSYVLEDDKSTKITFFEQGEDTYANLDTEDASISTKLVKGSPALVAIKGNRVSIAWATDNVYFVLIFQGLQVNEAMAVADSVVRIR